MDWDRVSDALNINVNVRPWRSGHVRQTGFSSSSPDAHSSTLSPLSQFQVHFHFFEWGSTHHIHAATLPHLRPHQASGTGLPPTSLKHNFVLSFYRLQPPPMSLKHNWSWSDAIISPRTYLLFLLQNGHIPGHNPIHQCKVTRHCFQGYN